MLEGDRRRETSGYSSNYHARSFNEIHDGALVEYGYGFFSNISF